MAYRRKQPFSRASTFTDDCRGSREDSKPSISRFSTFKGEYKSDDDFGPVDSSSLAALAIRASSAHRDSSISSAYGESAYRDPNWQRPDLSWQQQQQEGLAIAETTTADIISETRKLQIRRKRNNADPQFNVTDSMSPQKLQLQLQTVHETQLKASRDVAMAMAAKAKLLLRELKTVKADLAFAKERCQQLEEENKILRESHEKGDTPEDDDLIRLQLETLLAEKGRLANENSDYARENRFLREIVEYHQLTMQDVVYLDEGIDGVTEVGALQIIPVSDTRRPSPSPPPPSRTPDTGKGSPATGNPTNSAPNQGKADAAYPSSSSDATPRSENLKRRQLSPTPPSLA